ncbi:hypothetical protein [Streptomyces sp. NBC_01092]|uniref:hypothetical protein n=1 Tax=Streptomyces sp. NBC_01092 TaxID=2903748 RepID=UPI0038676521|nr:hypothetical protein OG254_22105 [Streptomyces sp. NBC_01092]
MRSRDGLSREEQDHLDGMRIACPDIASACDLARVFAGLVRDRRGHLLADWVREAETNGPGPVRGFAGFLRQDWDADLAGITLTLKLRRRRRPRQPFKTIKRQMYGRGSFRLLRTRVLLRS